MVWFAINISVDWKLVVIANLVFFLFLFFFNTKRICNHTFKYIANLGFLFVLNRSRDLYFIAIPWYADSWLLVNDATAETPVWTIRPPAQHCSIGLPAQEWCYSWATLDPSTYWGAWEREGGSTCQRSCGLQRLPTRRSSSNDPQTESLL